MVGVSNKHFKFFFDQLYSNQRKYYGAKILCLKKTLSKKPWKNMAQGSDKFWKRTKIMGKN